MKTPRPGRAVRGSKSGRPIMALLDLLGRRVSLRIIWELRVGALTFRKLQEAAETNPGVLNNRLAELRDAEIVTLTEVGYALTPQGRMLLKKHILPMMAWAERWAKRLSGP